MNKTTRKIYNGSAPSSGFAGPAQRACHFIDDLPVYIKDSYQRLALIVDETSLEHLDLDDEDTLIICCNWLLWHELVSQGRHAVHYELGILEWEISDSLNTDIFNSANDWLLDREGADPTLFHGVSLGRFFGAEISMAMMNFHRINRSIRSLIRRFKPKEIYFYNFEYDINHLSIEMRRDLIADISAEMGMLFVDKSDAAAEGKDLNVQVYRHAQAKGIRQQLAHLYGRSIEMVSRIRLMCSSSKTRVLVLANSNIVGPLAKGFQGGAVTPIFLARTIPKQFTVILNCLVRGILFANPRSPQLSEQDKYHLVEISDKISKICSEDGTPERRFTSNYLLRSLINMPALEEAAEEVLMAEEFIHRTRPSRIVVDSVRSRRHLSYIELGASLDIEIDYMWHAPLTPQNLKMGALGGDPRQRVFVNRCLSWGATNDRWLDEVEAPQPKVRIGSPLRNKYLAQSIHSPSSRKLISTQNVLLLQYGFNVLDLAGVNANMYGTFVNCVRLLRENGYRNIMLKMHPGPGRWTKSQFEQIRDFFDLDCKILMHEPFEECLAWADLVIGPSHTGAMFETLAANKPYHALLLPPHSTFDKSYFGDFPLIEKLKDLPAALQRDNTAAERKILDDLYSISDVPNPTQRFWQVMSEDGSSNPN